MPEKLLDELSLIPGALDMPGYAGSTSQRNRSLIYKRTAAWPNDPSETFTLPLTDPQIIGPIISRYWSTLTMIATGVATGRLLQFLPYTGIVYGQRCF